MESVRAWRLIFVSVCFSRTQLEAAAHNDWLEGLVSLEYEQWSEALKKFIQSEKIYRQVSARLKKVFSSWFLCHFFQLIQIGDSVEQSLYEKKASEINSQIELIQYKIDLSAGKGSAKRMIQLMSKMSVSLFCPRRYSGGVDTKHACRPHQSTHMYHE